LDLDQFARKIARDPEFMSDVNQSTHTIVQDPDYYEFEGN